MNAGRSVFTLIWPQSISRTGTARSDCDLCVVEIRALGSLPCIRLAGALVESANCSLGRRAVVGGRRLSVGNPDVIEAGTGAATVNPAAERGEAALPDPASEVSTPPL